MSARTCTCFSQERNTALKVMKSGARRICIKDLTRQSGEHCTSKAGDQPGYPRRLSAHHRASFEHFHCAITLSDALQRKCDTVFSRILFLTSTYLPTYLLLLMSCTQFAPALLKTIKFEHIHLRQAWVTQNDSHYWPRWNPCAKIEEVLDSCQQVKTVISKFSGDIYIHHFCQ